MHHYYLIVDLEATCDNDGLFPPREMETIEIGAVIVDAQNLEVVDKFCRFVRPVRHPRLTPFCSMLTSIQQSDVDAAPPFDQVMTEFNHWLFEYRPFLFCSWGDYDRKQVVQDCDFHNIPYPMGQHMNLKQAFSDRQGLKKKLGLAAALRTTGLQFRGTPHRGIDDAINIARLLPFIVQNSPSKIKIT